MDELLSMLADNASSNLPAQVEELSKAQREHAAATAELQTSLTKLESELEKAREDNKIMVVQKNKLITRMCVGESEKDEKRLRVETLEKDLSKAINENENLKSQIRQKEDEVVKLDKTCKGCTQRMEGYMRATKELEQYWPEIKELESTRQKLANLRKEKDTIRKKLESVSVSPNEIREGDMNELGKDIMELELAILKMRQRADETKKTFDERHRETKKLETTNMILKKRNMALLIRLKRQMESQKQRFGQLTNHVDRTADRLDACRSRLQQLTEQ